MGWMWSSSTTAAPAKAKGPSQDNNNKSEPQAPAKETQTKATNDYGDPELAKFMAQIQEELGAKPAATEPPKPAATATSPPPSSSSQTTAPPEQQQKPSTSLWSSWGFSSSPSSSSSSSSSTPTTTSRTSTSTSPSISPSPSTSTTTRSSSSLSSSTSSKQPPTRLDPLSESLLPRTMSCRAAFDQAYYCNSLGGQWMSVYRSGEVRACSEQWEDFWFCMRTRTYSGALKEEAIRDYYRRREIKRYHTPGVPSCTDVWEPRTERVEPGTAFREPLGEGIGGSDLDVTDEEWYAMEIERRRRVQAALKDS